MKEDLLHPKSAASRPRASILALGDLPARLEHKLQNPFSADSPKQNRAISSRIAFHSLAELTRRHLQPGGQRIRARLAWQAAQAVHLDEATGMALACCCEWLHNASLIHDDLQDGDSTRRDQPALWAEFGIGSAICAGDALISAAYGVLDEIETPPARLKTLVGWVDAAVQQTIVGQLADLTARRVGIDALEQYESIAVDKSGPLLGLPLALAVLAADGSDAGQTLALNAATAMTHLGVAYQLLDDLRDWQLDQREDGRHLLNAVLIESKGQPTNESITAVRHRARAILREAERRAADLPSALQAPVLGLADQLADRLDAA